MSSASAASAQAMTASSSGSWPTGRRSARGYLTSVTNAAGTPYWTANTVSATGKVLTETLGNGATTTRSYDVLDRMSGNVVAKTGVNLQNFTYTYDTIGNLTQRVDVVQSSLTENIAYDRLNRVLQTSGTGLTTKSYSYSAIGNLTYKSDAGTYTYPAVSAARPHAVSSITGTVNGFVNPGFTYDANGSMLTGLGRTFTYTSFNMPATVTGVRLSGGTSYSYTYTYNPEHERTKLVHSTLGTFIYLHPDGKGQLLYEKEIKTGGVVEHKSYINAGNLLIAAIIKRSDGTGDTRYFHHDRLGSVTTITNASGGVMERLAYDAFGKRRNPNGTDNPNNSLFGINTDRGFTGHEHLDEVALIHMNGRVYDPNIARFTSADPFVGQADNLQDYNRYSYVNNNPLMYTDPSGYFKFKDLLRIGAAVAAAWIIGPQVSAMFMNSAWAAAGNIMTAEAFFAAKTTAAMLGGASGGFAAGLIGSNGDFKSGLQGALTGGLFGAASGFGIDPMGAERIAAHAVAGCISSAAGGGSCGAGALSGAAGKFATGQLDGYKGLNDLGRGIAVAVVGGTTSAIAGGKFENGATTAAFGYLFNQMSQKRGPGIGGVRCFTCSYSSNSSGDSDADKLFGLDQTRPHGNSADSMRGTEVYYLINRNTGVIDKIGITSDAASRYSVAYLAVENVRYETQTQYTWRYAAMVDENIRLTFYRVEHGELPRLNRVTR